MISDADKKTILIKKFLDDALSSSDKIEFDALLEDVAFKKELNIQANLIHTLHENRRNDLESLLAEAKEELGEYKPIKAKLDKSKDRTTKGKIISLFIAAFLALGIYFGINKFINKTSSTDNLYAELYTPYPPENLERGEKSDYPEIYVEAMYAYADGEYQKALNQLEKLNPQTDKSNLYKAICLIELNRNNESVVILDALKKNSEDTSIRQQADWYLLINALKSKDNEQVHEIASAIINKSNHIFKDKAEKVLKALN